MTAARRIWLAAALLGLCAPALAGGAAAHERWTPRSQPVAMPEQPSAAEQERFLEDLSRRTFDWFWDLADPETGLVPNRWPGPPRGTSIGGMGFALTAWGIGAERGYITRAQAAERTRRNLRVLHDAPQGTALEGVSGQHGFYYHFLGLKTATRVGESELSTVDTALFLMGVLFAQSYFDHHNPVEAEIRSLAGKINARVDWPWSVRKETHAVIMGHRPERGGWGKAEWKGYNEAMMLYALGLGSPTHALDEASWTEGWSSGLKANWGTLYGYEHLTFGPLFGHQYSHAWIDFRGIQDGFMRGKGIDYFENSRRATLAQHAYAQDTPDGWTGYGENIWGWTASDGPGSVTLTFNGEERKLRGYAARGVGIHRTLDDGTIAPAAAGGSIPFAPEVAIPALMEMKERFGALVYNRYGLLDAFNMSVSPGPSQAGKGKLHAGFGWVDSDQLVIDQGVIL